MLLCNLWFFIIDVRVANFFKINMYETDLWYLIEILNNNNKSILLFIAMLIWVWLFQSFSNFSLYKTHFYCTFCAIIVLIFMYDTSYFNLSNYINKIINPNVSLINGIVLIHPLLVYYTYILFMLIFLLKNINTNRTVYIINFYKFRLLFSSLFGLFLGGYWAQQELNWGGWWNWDFVEIIALIFNVLALYLIHSNFNKHYNSTYILYRNIWYYLFCFFFFVRVDILNSIHSFNSISIASNYKFLLLYFVLFLLLFIIKNTLKYFSKFKLNFTNLNVVSLFFKTVNSIFLIYFLLNLFFIFYFNYQFLDITKYIKFLLILLIYLYVYLYKYYSNYLIFTFVIFNFYFFIHYMDLVIFLSFFFFFKTFNKHFFDKIVMFLHFTFFVFILNIKYNYIQLFIEYNMDYSFFKIMFNNNYILLDYTNIFCINTINNANNWLFNYFVINDNNAFYYTNNIYVNNIINNQYTYILYNLDKPIYYICYNTHLFLYVMLVVFLFLAVL
jgi:cytochrome c biogenesis factor